MAGLCYLLTYSVYMYSHNEHSYTDLNLLCKIWKRMPRLKEVIYNLIECLSFFHEFYDVTGFCMPSNDILSIFIICSSLQNTKISMYTYFQIYCNKLNKAAVCFFRVNSIVGRYFTTYDENEYVYIMVDDYTFP